MAQTTARDRTGTGNWMSTIENNSSMYLSLSLCSVYSTWLEIHHFPGPCPCPGNMQCVLAITLNLTKIPLIEHHLVSSSCIVFCAFQKMHKKVVESGEKKHVYLNHIFKTTETSPLITPSKVQKILGNATRSENTFHSFNIEVYENFFFQLSF